VGAELFRANVRTDMTKLIVAFRSSANAPKSEIRFFVVVCFHCCQALHFCPHLSTAGKKVYFDLQEILTSSMDDVSETDVLVVALKR
jgi:hypothetical protein